MSRFEIVDAHQHVGSLTDAASCTGRALGHDLPVEEDAAQRVALMDAAGIDWAVLQPSHGYLKPEGLRDTMRLNDRMARYKRIAPARFRAVLGTVEPMHGEHSLPEIDRCKHELRLDGLSWHHRFQGCFIDSPWMWPILERMRELALVPLVHVNVESSMEAHWRLQRLAQDFPDVSFLAMDGLWSYERCRHVFNTAALTPNIVWDFGGQVIYVTLEEWVGAHGSQTICFSADLAYQGGEAQRPRLLDLVERAAISDEDRANILGGNVRRLFRLG
jgi:predicted TIM-barrel fold metal-dependent hydrolase